MKSYLYTGDFMPRDIGKKSYIFVKGNTYSLPEEDKAVQSLVRLGKLTLIEETKQKGAK